MVEGPQQLRMMARLFHRPLCLQVQIAQIVGDVIRQVSVLRTVPNMFHWIQIRSVRRKPFDPEPFIAGQGPRGLAMRHRVTGPLATPTILATSAGPIPSSSNPMARRLPGGKARKPETQALIAAAGGGTRAYTTRGPVRILNPDGAEAKQGLAPEGAQEGASAPDTPQIDPSLAEAVAAWPALPEHVQEAVLTLVRAAGPRRAADTM